ncbi:TetR/AcrR family transcriptional regulator [Corynebacterium aquilae]|uniref:TetR/AcrR family transcriptional regulator n=1 Tax=Corynebacterium aquilae TaxID=203263 RepID=UPI000A0300E7|nr:TetR/AcrR family transcriptional regulator [Corynebacterium aquilae]
MSTSAHSPDPTHSPHPTDAAAQSYHHGDLKNTLLTLATEALDQGQPLSLRKLATKAGVSPTATYRHFKDKKALESALAARGYEQLTHQLAAAGNNVHHPVELIALTRAYVTFARTHAATFSLMFTTDCDPDSPERVQAVQALATTCRGIVAATLDHPSDEEVNAAATSLLAFTHGLATLILEKKLPGESDEEVHASIQQAWAGMGILASSS